MSKKLITAFMALVALVVVALPATASATNDPDLTHPTSTALATGKKILGTNIGITRMKDTAGNTLVECTTARMTGTLTKNDGSNVEGTIESTTFAGSGSLRDEHLECTSTFGGISVDTNIGNGTPWCLRSTATMATDEFQVRGDSCSNPTRSITFVLTSTTVGTCKYQRAEAIKGTYATHATGDAILTLLPNGNTEFTKHEGGIFCPSIGTLEMQFTLETDSATPEPLYIS